MKHQLEAISIPLKTWFQYKKSIFTLKSKILKNENK